MAIPYRYGGIVEVFGDISYEGADEILDIIDLYQDILEALEGDNHDGQKISGTKGSEDASKGTF